jgi:hypothetical protein
VALKVRIVPFIVTELGITFNPLPPSTDLLLQSQEDITLLQLPQLQ